MAGNFIQDGDVLTLTAPATVASGDGVLVGSIFGVALGDIGSGDSGEFAVEGVWELAAVTAEAIAAGGPVYWDAGQKKCSNGSTGNELIGYAVATKDGSTATVKVRLNGFLI